MSLRLSIIRRCTSFFFNSRHMIFFYFIIETHLTKLGSQIIQIVKNTSISNKNVVASENSKFFFRKNI